MRGSRAGWADLRHLGYNGIRVWDRALLQTIRALETRPTIPIALSYTPDSRALVAVAREGIWHWKLSPSPLPFLALLLAIGGIIVWIALSSAAGKAVRQMSRKGRTRTEDGLNDFP